MQAIDLSIPFVGFIVLAFAAIFFFTFRKARQKIEKQLSQSFGKTPMSDTLLPPFVAAYHKYHSASIESDKRVDAITWNDLNMDNVFHRINACTSTIGEEYLFHTLHALEITEKTLSQREQRIQWALENPQRRIELQKILRGIGKRPNNGLSHALFHAEKSGMKHAYLFTPLAVLPIAGLMLLPFFTNLGVVITVLALSVNCAIYYIVKLKLDHEMETTQYFSAMIHALKKLQRRFPQEISSFGLPFASSLKPFKFVGGFLSGSAKAGLMELEVLIVLLKAFFLVDVLVFNRIIKKMRMHPAECAALFQMIGELDMAVAVASFRKSLPHWCEPTFHQEKRLVFTGVFHPLIQHPVVNDGNIANDSLITGSNASGKSTFLKSLAINGILAQTIHTCCAQSYWLQQGYVATSMALRDDIVAGESYFIAEIKSIKRILQFCQRQYCMCFIDEILRGTNTIERIAASTAVLRHLHESGSLSIVASHDIELTKNLQGVYTLYHFCETIVHNEIQFDYLMKDGPSTSTNAIKLLEILGLDKRIIDEAKRLAEDPRHENA